MATTILITVDSTKAEVDPGVHEIVAGGLLGFKLISGKQLKFVVLQLREMEMKFTIHM